MCSPATSIRSASARAASGAMPNFEPAWPVRMCSWVSASTPGTTRMSRREPPFSRSASCSLSITTVPTPASQRHVQLGVGLGVAVQVEPPGLEAGAQGEVQLAAGRHIAAQALLGEHAQHRRAREGLGGEHDLAGPLVDASQRVRRRCAPGSAGRPPRRRRRACRTRAPAHARRSRRCSATPSVTEESRGYTAAQAIYARAAAGADDSARRCTSAIHTTPPAIIAIDSSCG